MLAYPKHTLSSFRFPSVDVNDNVPFFTSSIYEASVTEGADSGTLVFQVSANDLDLGLNGKVNTHLTLVKLMMLLSGWTVQRDVNNSASFQEVCYCQPLSVLDYPKICTSLLDNCACSNLQLSRSPTPC